jgi:hypothetical protein
MSSRNLGATLSLLVIMIVCAVPVTAQSFRVQCPTSTITHPDTTTTQLVNSSEPAYAAPTTLKLGGNGYMVPSANVNGAIKCQQISGGDGYSTMANGTQTFMFSFGPLSGIADIARAFQVLSFRVSSTRCIRARFFPAIPPPLMDQTRRRPTRRFRTPTKARHSLRLIGMARSA